MSAHALLIAAALTLQAAERPFVSEAGGFRVRMPATPALQTQRVVTRNGPIDVHFCIAIEGNVTFIASYSDRPAELAKAGPGPLLQGAVKAAVDGLDGTILDAKDCTLGPLPGKEVSFSFPGPEGRPGLGLARIYLKGARMYSLTVVGPKGEADKDGAGFLGSFRVIETAAAPTISTIPSPSTSMSAASDGTPFISEAGGFRVAMPAARQEHHRQFRTTDGTIDSHYYTAARGGLTLLASFNDLPGGLTAESPKGRFDDILKGTVGPRGKLLDQRDVALGTVPGREFRYTRPAADGRVISHRSRVYLVPGRYYQLQVSGPDDRVSGPDGDAYLNSFTLTRP